MRNVWIEPKSEGKEGKEVKGRTFRAVLLASVEADLLWRGGSSGATDSMRPVWAMFAGSDQELRAFMANLTAGRLVMCEKRYGYYRSGKQERLEFLRSAGYQTIWQREDEGVVATIYLPDLFKLDPGMVDPSGIGFVILPTQEWHAQQILPTFALALHLERCGYELGSEWAQEWATTAHLFAAYLDRRTRCPLIADGRFYTQLLAACLKNKLASFAPKDSFSHSQDFGVHKEHDYHETDTQLVGFRKGLVFRSDHTKFETVLAQEVEIFFRVTEGRR
jgi:hypothetical protein